MLGVLKPSCGSVKLFGTGYSPLGILVLALMILVPTLFMLLLVNKKELMGEYVSSPLYNVIAWTTTVVMVGLTLAWFWTLRGGSG